MRRSLARFSRGRRVMTTHPSFALYIDVQNFLPVEEPQPINLKKQESWLRTTFFVLRKGGTFYIHTDVSVTTPDFFTSVSDISPPALLIALFLVWCPTVLVYHGLL